MGSTNQHITISKIEDLSALRRDNFILALQAGVPGAFAELYETYSRRLYHAILAITRNHQDTEDALQETFLRVHMKIHTFEGRSSIYSWLTRIAINSGLMVLRRRRSQREILFDPHPKGQSAHVLTNTVALEIRDSALDPEQSYDLRQCAFKLLHAIEHLDPKLKTPILMQAILGSSLEEIARAMDISEAAVKSRLHRARRRLSTRQGIQRLGPQLRSVNVHEQNQTIVHDLAPTSSVFNRV
jgi:RNA polymerase sigma-70 factor (ECF subfamily)